MTVTSRAIRSLVVVGLVLATAGTVVGVRLATRADAAAPVPNNAPVPRSEAIEMKFGVRITRVSVIAGGGIVELRYLLLDPAAAAALHADTEDLSESFPRLVADDTVLSVPTFHHHGGDLVAGRELSILYANTNGAVVDGSIVSVSLGDETLPGVPVG